MMPAGPMYHPPQFMQVAAPPTGWHTPNWSLPTRRTAPVFEIVVLVLSTIGVFLCVLDYVIRGGVFNTTVMAFLAVPSLVAVVLTLSRIDRWESEPLWTRMASLAWGAGVATLLAGVLNGFSMAVLYYGTYDEALAYTGTAVIIAPITEESLKGFVVLLLVLLRRHHFQSYLDGVVHAGLVGAGFAFVENIQYFLDAGVNYGVEQVAFIVFLRGVMSPFLHPMATSMIGLSLGWAVTRMRSRWAWVWMAPLGWLGATTIHGLWNLMASVSGEYWLFLYAVFQVPLFLTWLIALLLAAKREAGHIARGLQPYVDQGWILRSEVQMATHGPARRNALRWAAGGGSTSRKAMDRFLNLACALGLDQLLMSRIGPDQRRIEHDRQMLQDLIAARNVFLQATNAAPVVQAPAVPVHLVQPLARPAAQPQWQQGQWQPGAAQPQWQQGSHW